MDNDEIKELVEDEFGYIGLDDSAKQLVEMFIKDIMKHEKVSIDDITEAGDGKTCAALKIGEYVLKVGKTRRTKTFKNSSRILQPIIRREIETNSDTFFVEVQNEVEANWFKENPKKVFEVMYGVYKDLRDDGLVWTDIKMSNIGRLKKDNRINYKEMVHDENGNLVAKEIIPSEAATGLKGKQGKILKAGDYVLLDTDFVFDENDLPDGKQIKDILMKLYYENFELKYKKEKGKAKNISR